MGDPIAESEQSLINQTISGQWFSSTINYSAKLNTTYRIGYYSDALTQYAYNLNNDYLTVTSQPKIENSNWLPVSWSYEEKSILSMCAVYTHAELQSAEDELPLETQVN